MRHCQILHNFEERLISYDFKISYLLTVSLRVYMLTDDDDNGIDYNEIDDWREESPPTKSPSGDSRRNMPLPLPPKTGKVTSVPHTSATKTDNVQHML